MKTRIENDKNYLVLQANERGEIRCPFCNEKHKHGRGGGNGHRLAHCTKVLIKNPVFLWGKWFFKEDGYFVEFL